LQQLNLNTLSFVATVVAALSADSIVKIALLWPETRELRSDATPENNRLRPLFAALSRLGTDPEPAVYSDELADEVRDQLRSWTRNPKTSGRRNRHYGPS
jgi:hypothetical protein